MAASKVQNEARWDVVQKLLAADVELDCKLQVPKEYPWKTREAWQQPQTVDAWEIRAVLRQPESLKHTQTARKYEAQKLEQ